ncbi:TPA: anaerobic ribonucleoside-triphosphate reductase activating protein [Candidatus Bathyarchaeota archaeon]|nr:anaerobic ribonucleoside-triphosphate reductase activating protein [Candidatus Bathyarchaeota archaeon]
MKFSGIEKTSLVDFPDRVSTVLFTPGCNLRCPYCYNWRIVLEPKGPYLSEEAALRILKSRKRYIDAVVITGGEPTIHNDLPKFLKRLKEEGFFIKLDTNGLLPNMLLSCMPYLDYVALDVKTSPQKYPKLGAREIDVQNFLCTVNLLKEGAVDYEFRCTVIPHLVEEEDITVMGELVNSGKRFVFQQFIPGDTLDKKFSNVRPFSPQKILKFGEIMRKYVDEVIMRI